jgi:catechol 2,3-dioxygenase-like lactoylglutathione lyase family enzyme
MSSQYTGSNVTIMVSSMAKALKFYTEILGLTLKVRYNSHWAEVTAPGITIGLHPKIKNKDFNLGNTISIGLEVKDINAAIADIQQKGIEVEVYKDSYVHQGSFNDIDGNTVYFFQHKSKKSAK